MTVPTSNPSKSITGPPRPLPMGVGPTNLFWALMGGPDGDILSWMWPISQRPLPVGICPDWFDLLVRNRGVLQCKMSGHNIRVKLT